MRLVSDFGFKKSELPQLRTKDKPMFVKSLISKSSNNETKDNLDEKESTIENSILKKIKKN